MTPARTTAEALTETVRAHAEAVRAQLARITALREASPDIATPPSGLNPLDLGALDPLTPGAFPGIGREARGRVRRGPGRGSSTWPLSSSQGTGQPDGGSVETPTDGPRSEEPEPPPKTLEELLAELDALTGLTEVKAEIHRQVAVLRVEGLRAEGRAQVGDHHPAPGLRRQPRHRQDDGGPAGRRHLPGARPALQGPTGRGRPVRAGRGLPRPDRHEDRGGGGQGRRRGVLFIDEAYSLAGDQYGQESVDTLVKEMEDRRDDLVLIVAGYPDPMVLFIAQNPGLASRFRTTIEFADYTDDELVEIFGGLAAAADYDVTPECLDRFRTILLGTPRGPSFGNGRFARNPARGRHRPPRLAVAGRGRTDGRAAPAARARGPGGRSGRRDGPEPVEGGGPPSSRPTRCA